MKVIGLTGGIASGVSLVASVFRELGAAVIEADRIARDVVAPGTEAYRKIIDAFGRQIVLPDGSLDRRGLGALVFKDPAARRRLNTITHPEIRRRIREQVERTAGERPDAVILVDIPLLLDTAGPDVFDLDAVIVVQATPEQQISRLIARDGLTREEAESRLAAQRPVAEKATEADWVIDNSGSIEQTRAQVEALWAALTASNT
ncbi:MAG TPA: dephospho-CoA kinase [bacterium]|nr:dephospho-CoA kinase [bacterium]